MYFEHFLIKKLKHQGNDKLLRQINLIRKLRKQINKSILLLSLRNA